MRRQYDKAYKILEENREKLDEIAQKLYEQETITGDEFMAILGLQEENEQDKNSPEAGKGAEPVEKGFIAEI